MPSSATRRSQYVGIAVGLMLGIPIVVAAGLYTFPQIEARYSPVIDPATDKVSNVRVVDNSLCWRSTFDKLKEAHVATYTHELLVYGPNGDVGRQSVAPKRVGGPQAPNADIVDLEPGHHSVDWCLPLDNRKFTKLEVLFNSEYETPGGGWWMVPTPRATVTYIPAQPPAP